MVAQTTLTVWHLLFHISGCTNLTEASLSVTSIGGGAFQVVQI